MIIILKIVLFLLSAADAFVAWNVFNDFRAARNQEGFDELSIWRRFRFNMTSFFIIASLISLFVFLWFFIISRIQIL